MEIRKGTLKDLEAIAAVEAACFPAAEAATAEEFSGRLQQYGDHFWLLWEGERLLAFVDGFCTDWPDLTDEMYADASTAAMASKSFKVPLRISINILPSFSSECTTVPAQRQRSCRFFLFGPFASAAAPCYNGYIASRKGADTPCPPKNIPPSPRIRRCAT